jgi:diacylglycerol O-acyltransferase / wax synthase
VKRLSGSDQLFLSLETPEWHQHIAGLNILDPSDRDDFGFEASVAHLARRLDLAPKFRWKLKNVPLGLDRPGWIEDDNFDLARHIHRVGVPRPGGRAELAELYGEIMTSQLNRRIPLWEFWYIDGLAEGRVATVLKFHHALLDGVSGASLATVLADLEPDAAHPPIPDDLPGAGAEPSDSELILRSIIPNARAPFRLARYVAEAANRGVAMLQFKRGSDAAPPITGIPRTRWNQAIGPRRAATFASVSLDDMKRIKRHHDVKINDVVLAMVGGALRAYLEGHEELPERSLLVGVPISTRAADDDELDNKIANMTVAVATDVADPIERLLQIHRNSQAAKEMTEAMRAKRIQSIGETAPPLMLNLAVRALHQTGAVSAMPTVINAVVSNVPGPPFPLYFAGAEIKGMYPGSIIMEGMGLNITVLSYIDRVDIGLTADPELVPDLWDMADLMPAAIDELMQASGLGPATEVVDPFGA